MYSIFMEFLVESHSVQNLYSVCRLHTFWLPCKMRTPSRFRLIFWSIACMYTKWPKLVWKNLAPQSWYLVHNSCTTTAPDSKQNPKRHGRGGRRNEKLVMLLLTDPIKNVGGAKGCLLRKLSKIGVAWLVSASAWFHNVIQAHDLKILVGKIAENYE